MGGVAGVMISKVLGHVSSQSLQSLRSSGRNGGTRGDRVHDGGCARHRPLSAEEPHQQTKG